MEILDRKYVKKFFGLDELKSEEYPFLREGDVPEAKYWSLRYDEYLKAVKAWAHSQFPQAEEIDCCSFAALVLYFATGIYGGWGTERYTKERYAEAKAYSFYSNACDGLNSKQASCAIIYLLVSHLLQKMPPDEKFKQGLEDAIRLLEESKKHFKSRQVAEARKILEGLK